ncbi:MAG: ANTAR domain-containing response regulator [Acutalibacteraceae bacterium]
MSGVLLVSSLGKPREFLQALLNESGMDAVKTADSCAAARRALQSEEPELAVINAPVGDESGLELAREIAHSTTASVILLLKADSDPMLFEKAEQNGVLVLEKPLSRQLFLQTVRIGVATRQRLLWLKNENHSLQNKIEEIRLIDRAKCTLIQYLGLSEPQAHRYIEKQAMDRRTGRLEVAKGILKTYET